MKKRTGAPAIASARTTIGSTHGILLAAVLLMLAAVAIYSNSFSVPFLFDDANSIVGNPTIRRLWSLAVLSPPFDMTVGGRPFVNATLAVNYALSGTRVGSYHAVNLIIHVLAGLTLFGVMRRTLMRPALRARFGKDALPLALTISLLWIAHPLQTESVTYVIQRAESLVSLFYLVTLYCVIRGADSRTPRRWHASAFVACLLGMASKEVMISAPFVVLLYDHTFIAGSFRESWRRRRWLYVCLFSTWLPLAFLVAGTHGRGGSAGFATGVAWWSYALTQCWAIVRYLGLVFWPHPLIFDYGMDLIRDPVRVGGQIAILLALLAVTLAALKRWPAIGFSGACFFAILAPSSSIAPVASHTIAEHRAYLALAPVLALIVLGLPVRLGRRSLLIFWIWAAALGWLAHQRNLDYRSEIALWSDTGAKRPGNARAQSALGAALAKEGRLSEAIARLEEAVRLRPDYADAHNNLGSALVAAGRWPEAIARLETALRLTSGQEAAPHFNLGDALFRAGRIEDAVRHYETGLRLRPGHPDALNNLGNALRSLGRNDDAIACFEQALRIMPDLAEAENNLGTALADEGQWTDAIRHYEAALRINPDLAEAENNIGAALLATGRPEEAAHHCETALRLKPDFAAARLNLGAAYASLGRLDEALAQYEMALKLKPESAEAENSLGNLLIKLGRVREAIAHFERALRLNPNYAEAENGLGAAWAVLGSTQEALMHYRAALRLKPGYASAQRNLDSLLAKKRRAP